MVSTSEKQRLSTNTNPFKVETDEYREWSCGYVFGQAKATWIFSLGQTSAAFSYGFESGLQSND